MVETSKPVALNAMQTNTVYTTFSIAGSAPASTQVMGTLYEYGLGLPSVATINVPSSEVWHLADVFVQSALTIDLQFQLIINGLIQPLVFNLNSAIVSNNARFKLPTPITIMPNSNFSVNVITYSANSATTAVTEACYVVFLRSPA